MKSTPYRLQELKIERVNQVWSTDITYIRLGPGFVYLSSIWQLPARELS